MFQWLPRLLAVKVKIQSPKRSYIICSLLMLLHELLLSSWLTGFQPQGPPCCSLTLQACSIADLCASCSFWGTILPPPFHMAIALSSFHTQISLHQWGLHDHPRSNSNSHPVAFPAFFTVHFSAHLPLLSAKPFVHLSDVNRVGPLHLNSWVQVLACFIHWQLLPEAVSIFFNFYHSFFHCFACYG